MRPVHTVVMRPKTCLAISLYIVTYLRNAISVFGCSDSVSDRAQSLWNGPNKESLVAQSWLNVGVTPSALAQP